MPGDPGRDRVRVRGGGIGMGGRAGGLRRPVTQPTARPGGRGFDGKHEVTSWSERGARVYAREIEKDLCV
jgi:hypothetical protein